MLAVSQLYIYPIKSLGGIAVAQAEVTDRGLAHDRRYMLVTHNGVFMSQRSTPRMALLRPRLTDYGLEVYNAGIDGSSVSIIQPPADAPTNHRVTVWRQTVAAQHVSDQADSWFSHALKTKCKLVYMPDRSLRRVDSSTGQRPAGKVTSFADAYPFLLIGEESLADLNRRHPSDSELTMARFRPNIVCAGGAPYAEDEIGSFTVNGISFTGLEKCARCGVPNIDPVTAKVSSGRKPLRTLAEYRTEERKVYFGMNLIHTGTGRIAVGDLLLLPT